MENIFEMNLPTVTEDSFFSLLLVFAQILPFLFESQTRTGE